MNDQKIKKLLEAIDENLTLLLSTQRQRIENYNARIQENEAYYDASSIADIEKHKNEINGFYQCFGLVSAMIDLPTIMKETSGGDES